jgi:Ran GTPase-activating protein (RanGAP) involved in mRNA processing and transport
MSFEGNEFGDDITSELCRCMMELKNAQVLNLSKCGITDIGA